MRAVKLLLVSANRHTSPYPVYPLGLAYLGSFLAENMPDLEIRIFDFIKGNYVDYLAVLRDFNPDYTGISLRNIDDVNFYRQESFIDHYRQVISTTRLAGKSTIILGGAGFSIYPERLFEMLEPDFAIYGEGETSLYKLLRALGESDNHRDIEGLLYRENGNTVINRRKVHFQHPLLRFDSNLVDYYWKHSGMLNIQTKRGCPYKCIYCTYPLIEGSQVRTLSSEQVIQNLYELYHQKGIDYVFFTDSIFNINNPFNLELAEGLINANLPVKWGGYFNFADIDFKLLEKLRDAGLRHIEFGTESLSDTMLCNYRKPFTVQDILETSRICNELGIDFAHFLILGGYGETNATLEESFENSRKIERTVFFPYIGMRIYPGTRLHQIAIEEKRITADDPLLEPVYYVSESADLNTLKQKALQTGRPWIFPDDDLSQIMTRMRMRNKKGPLWEYLIK